MELIIIPNSSACIGKQPNSVGLRVVNNFKAQEGLASDLRKRTLLPIPSPNWTRTINYPESIASRFGAPKEAEPGIWYI